MIKTEGDKPTDSIALALQRTFFRLQTNGQPVGTTELTRSFGWDSIDAFMQHDVHEFNRVLLDELETMTSLALRVLTSKWRMRGSGCRSERNFGILP